MSDTDFSRYGVFANSETYLEPGSPSIQRHGFAIAKPVSEFTLFAGPRPDDPIRQR